MQVLHIQKKIPSTLVNCELYSNKLIEVGIDKTFITLNFEDLDFSKFTETCNGGNVGKQRCKFQQNSSKLKGGRTVTPHISGEATPQISANSRKGC